MTLNMSTNEIKVYSGQVFTTEKFAVTKIINRVRLLTGLPELISKQFLWEVIEDFCEKTWILRKLIQVGAILTETDNDSDYYMVEIDLTAYADGLLVHDINEISINGTTFFITKNSYLGNPTGSNESDADYPGAYIESGTLIGPATYMGATVAHHGELTDGVHYEIVDDTTIKIWPVNLDDVLLVPIIFKTSSTATEIPFILEDYYKHIASGVIAEIRQIPRYMSPDEEYHKMNYKKGISRAKFDYAKQYKGHRIQNNYFAL